MTRIESIVKNYIEGYNNFDIDKMVMDFDEQIVFVNIENGSENLTLTGLAEFRRQAEQANAYFSERTQAIKSIIQTSNRCEIEIDYRATLAMDLPNGLKKGQELILTGKSVFEFDRDKIIRLTDIS
jgi:hypothetical protein